MVFRILSLYFYLLIIFISSIQTLPLSNDYFIENSSSSNLPNMPSIIIHPLNFISLICQQQEQYSLKLTRKLCSNYFQSFKLQEDTQQQQQQQQQRGKRVGWTISV